MAICSGGGGVVGRSGWWVIGRGSAGDDGALWQLVVAAVQRC